ncbi:MAG TPA: protease HtpX [Myxococcota bacterium]|jgi:heat shock protein HtpX|nr:protease HtpX [Myxococcota bacterium]
MRRVLYFVATNVAILLVLSVVLRVLGVDRYLDQTGTGLDYWHLLIFAAVFGMGGSFLSLAISKWSALRMTGAKVIDQPRNELEGWLVQSVARHAQAAGIGMPQVAIYDAPEPNAFATGARRDKALVAVSSGLLRGMTRDEADAVLAHEVSHVANGDMVTLTLIQGVVNTFVLFLSRVIGDVVDRAVFRREGEGHGPAFFLVSIFAQIVLGILASLIVFWFSRQREFRADAGGATLAGRPNMIAALERLRRAAPEPLPERMAAFGISGVNRRGGLAHLFATHPPLEERVERLKSAT